MRYAGSGHAHDATRALWMRYLQLADWETIGLSGFGQRHIAWWFYAGFTQNFGNQLPGGSESADEVANKALAWLDANGTSDNWFMHVNFWDVHTPYRAPEEYAARMRGQPTPPHPTAEEIAWDAEYIYGPRTARDWWCDQSGFRNDQRGATAGMPRPKARTLGALPHLPRRLRRRHCLRRRPGRPPAANPRSTWCPRRDRDRD